MQVTSPFPIYFETKILISILKLELKLSLVDSSLTHNFRVAHLAVCSTHDPVCANIQNRRRVQRWQGGVCWGEDLKISWTGGVCVCQVK